MAITFHPDPGTVLICDFDGLKPPEMTKRRPCVVVSPRLRRREGLCTIVPLSTTAPHRECDYHCRLSFEPRLPPPYSAAEMWVKADMLYVVRFERLSLPFVGKDGQGVRQYDIRHISEADLLEIRRCMLRGLGLAALTSGL